MVTKINNLYLCIKQIKMLKFNYKKAIQALNFFAEKEGGEINYMKALKLIWLSDRKHIRRFARPIVNDDYYALKNGPIASKVKDFTQDNNSFIEEYESEYRNLFLKTSDKFHFKSISAPVLNVFSKSDIQIMEDVYNEFGKHDQFTLSKISHNYQEWKRYENLINAGVSRVSMDYSDFFDGNDSFFNETKEMLDIARDIYKENCAIANLV